MTPVGEISGSVAKEFIWVSPYHPDDSRGGWKAMQFHLLRALEMRWGIARKLAPIEVPEEFLPKWTSRICKKLSIPRRYAYYSDSRLNEFARVVDARLPVDASVPVVFFGALPFVKCRPTAPYFIYTDGAFFIHYWEYNQDHSHAQSEIERICLAEAEFMRSATGVWCSSQQVADRIVKEYGADAGKVRFVGTGPGNIPSPAERLTYENFVVMIAADFERKQGRLAVEVVAEARKLGVNVSIKFIGDQPPADVMAQSFVEWCGWLDMKADEDRRRFAEVMSKAGAQLLLSRSDLTPLAIPEAASYAKATIATAVGGIPEMIEDGRTGWLVPADAPAARVANLLAELFSSPAKLAHAGEAAKVFCATNWSWDAVTGRAIEANNTVTTG